MSFKKNNNKKNNNQLGDIDYVNLKEEYNRIINATNNNMIDLDDDEILKIREDFKIINSFLNKEDIHNNSSEDIFSIEARRIADYIQNQQSLNDVVVSEDVSGVVDDVVVSEDVSGVVDDVVVSEDVSGVVDDVVVSEMHDEENDIIFNSIGTLTDDMDKEIVIKVENVTMEYKIVKEKIDTIKEFVIRTFKRNIKQPKMFTALKNISFEIQKGDRVGIIGFNGAGKSTLLKLLSGVYYPTEGTIKTKGKLAPLLELGAGFDNNYTGKANIFLNGAFLGFSETFLKEKYDEILEFSELGEAINYPVKNYSSGMRAKLGFSIATLVEPDILIIDEILSVGDLKFQKKSSEKLRSLINSGITVLMVSHSVSQIREICNKAIWIDKGEIMMMGDVNLVCDSYEKVARGSSINQFKNIIQADDNNRKYKDKMDNSGIIRNLKLENNNLTLDTLLFNDFAIEDYKNMNYLSYNILSETNADGTKVFSNFNEEGFYYINQRLSKDLDFIFSFKWVDGYYITPIIQIRSVENMNVFVSFQKQDSDIWSIYSKNFDSSSINLVDFVGNKSFNQKKINHNDEIRLIKIGNNISIYCENDLVIEYEFSFSSDIYIGFGSHSMGKRCTTYKDLMLYSIK